MRKTTDFSSTGGLSLIRSAEGKKSKKEFYKSTKFTTASDLANSPGVIGSWIKDLTPLGAKSPLSAFR